MANTIKMIGMLLNVVHLQVHKNILKKEYDGFHNHSTQLTMVKCSNIYTGTFFKYFLCWNVLSITGNVIYESRRIAAEIHLTEMLIFWRIRRVTREIKSLPQSSWIEAIEKKIGDDFKGADPYLERARTCSNSLYTLLLWGWKAIMRYIRTLRNLNFQ